jgi:hypothetical protein
MRKRSSISLKLSLLLSLVAAAKPHQAPAETSARLLSEFNIPRDAAWIGGISAIDLSPDGLNFYLATDRGYLARGRLLRTGDTLEGLDELEFRALVNRFGVKHAPGFGDAEGIAVDARGRIFVSFETEDRVVVYEDWDSPERLATFTRAWDVFPENQGLEALALASDNTLWAIPEYVWNGGTEVRLYHRAENKEWRQETNIPTDGGFVPVGADFGPDGNLYLLERAFFSIGFASRVRRLKIEDGIVSNVETVLRTFPGRHGNLEGIAVWSDDKQNIHLTMVSDDNFLAIQRNQIVEYVLDDRVALPAD